MTARELVKMSALVLQDCAYVGNYAVNKEKRPF